MFQADVWATKSIDVDPHTLSWESSFDRNRLAPRNLFELLDAVDAEPWYSVLIEATAAILYDGNDGSDATSRES